MKNKKGAPKGSKNAQKADRSAVKSARLPSIRCTDAEYNSALRMAFEAGHGSLGKLIREKVFGFSPDPKVVEKINRELEQMKRGDGGDWVV